MHVSQPEFLSDDKGVLLPPEAGEHRRNLSSAFRETKENQSTSLALAVS